MTYYRDPLLDTICDRIAGLGQPAYVKNSELVFVAANAAFAQLFDLLPAQLIGTSGAEHAELGTLIDLGDKERSCLVFGEDQRAHYADPFGRGRFLASMERFILADGQSFLYCMFEDQSSTIRRLDTSATEPMPAASSEALPESAGGKSDSADLFRGMLDSLPMPAFLRDANHKLVFANKAFADIVGVSSSISLAQPNSTFMGLVPRRSTT